MLVVCLPPDIVNFKWVNLFNQDFNLWMKGYCQNAVSATCSRDNWSYRMHDDLLLVRAAGSLMAGCSQSTNLIGMVMTVFEVRAISCIEPEIQLMIPCSVKLSPCMCSPGEVATTCWHMWYLAIIWTPDLSGQKGLGSRLTYVYRVYLLIYRIHGLISTTG